MAACTTTANRTEFSEVAVLNAQIPPIQAKSQIRLAYGNQIFHAAYTTYFIQIKPRGCQSVLRGSLFECIRREITNKSGSFSKRYLGSKVVPREIAFNSCRWVVRRDARPEIRKGSEVGLAAIWEH